MIVPMNKVSIVLLAREKDALLKKLQISGLVEIIEAAEKTDKPLEEKIELYYKIRRTVAELKKDKKKHKYIHAPQESGDPLQILQEYDSLHGQLADLTRELEKLEMDEVKIRPWGNFHMEEIEKLRTYGVNAHFYIMAIRKFKTLELENVAYEVIRRDKKMIYFVVFSREKLTLPATEIFPPMESLERLAMKIMQCVKDRDDVEKKLLECTRYIQTLEDYDLILKNEISYDRASLHCDPDENGRMVFISGWLAKKSAKKLSEILDEYPLFYEIEEPTAEDNPPVLLKNIWFVRPFEAITKIFSLPSYFEMDPTPLFAPFFMLFFGLCIADVGYAMVLLAVLGIAYFKVGENLKPMVKLAIILGAFTMVAGYWLNTFFGFSLYENEGIKNSLITENTPGDFLASYLEEGKMVFPAITFSLLLGFTQVSFGIALSLTNKWKESGFKFALQPFAYLLMMFSAVFYGVHKDMMGMSSIKIGQFDLGALLMRVPADVSLYLLGAGVFFLLFFNNPDKKIWVRPPMALWELYQFISGLVGDILSYLRLFALGLAGGLLGGAFNNIAFMVMKPETGGYTIMGVFFGVLIMVLGHSLNIILSILGAFVHSLRLTFVEFYKNLQFKGGGKPFTPFTLEK